MNQVNIIGRLGADVDLRYTTTSQKAVAKMSVAVNDRYGKNERACPPMACDRGFFVRPFLFLWQKEMQIAQLAMAGGSGKTFALGA